MRAKLKDLGFDLADNQLNDVFVRFKDLADRKKEVFDDDLVALMRVSGRDAESGSGQVSAGGLRHRGAATADLTMEIDGK